MGISEASPFQRDHPGPLAEDTGQGGAVGDMRQNGRVLLN